MNELLLSGIVPADGDFGGGLIAQYVFVADGMPWFEQHLIKLLPGVVVILDAFHIMERLAAYSKRSKGLHDPNGFYRTALNLLLGRTPKAAEPGYQRKGPKKRRKPPFMRCRHRRATRHVRRRLGPRGRGHPRRWRRAR